MQTLFDLLIDLSCKEQNIKWRKHDAEFNKSVLQKMGKSVEERNKYAEDPNDAMVAFNAITQAFLMSLAYGTNSNAKVYVFARELAVRLQKSALAVGYEDINKLQHPSDGDILDYLYILQVADSSFFFVLNPRKLSGPGVCFKVDHAFVRDKKVLVPSHLITYQYDEEGYFSYEKGEVTIISFLSSTRKNTPLNLKIGYTTRALEPMHACDLGLLVHIPKLVYYLRKHGNPDLREYKPPVIATKKEKKALRQFGDQSAFDATHVGFGFGKDPLYLKDSWTYFRQQAHGPKFSDRKLIEITAHRRIGRE